MSGHTMSGEHEQSLLQVGSTSYPGKAIVTDFEPLGIVPDYWVDTTIQMAYLLAEANSADAVLTSDTLEVRAVIVNALAWQSRLNAIRPALPDEVTLHTDTVLVDNSIDVTSTCERALDDFPVGQINFEESSVVFRPSAYPRLDRVIAIAQVCRTSLIAITGHTDATGSEAVNQRLSEQRANAVGDYLVAGGIERERLRVRGAGSEQPLADNSTRYGRSLNRRIEISLHLSDPGE